MPIVNPANNNQEAFNPRPDNASIAANANQAGRIITYISFILIIPAILFIAARNNLIRLQNKINESASGIDVQLKNRRDTLTKLVDATKGSMNFEREVLTSVTALRGAQQGNSVQSLQETDANLARLSGRILATFEAYPQVRSTENVARLIESAQTLEQEIAATRRLYNSYTTEFNTRIFTWPGSVVATNMHLAKLPLFAASVEDRQDVRIAFN